MLAKQQYRVIFASALLLHLAQAQQGLGGPLGATAPAAEGSGDDFLEDADWFEAEEDMNDAVENTTATTEELTEEELQEAAWDQGLEAAHKANFAFENEQEERFEAQEEAWDRGVKAAEEANEKYMEKVKEDNEYLVEFETFDDQEFEQVLKRQNALTPEDFEKFLDEENQKYESALSNASAEIAAATESSSDREIFSKLEASKKWHPTGTVKFEDNEEEKDIEPASLNDMVEHEHEHDAEHCDECQRNALEESNMQMALVGFVLFGMILFLMWYMLRSCKNGRGEQLESQGQQKTPAKRSNKLSPYSNVDNDSNEFDQSQVDLEF